MYDISSLRVNVITILDGILYTLLGRDSLLDIATCYGLDGPAIESRWGDETSRTLPYHP
jgi:hypothetical protein